MCTCQPIKKACALRTLLQQLTGYLLLSLFLVAAWTIFLNDYSPTTTLKYPSVTPWQSIGGCGLGGSGAGTEAIEWIGRGVQGYQLSLEMQPRMQLGRFDNLTSSRLTVAPRFTWHPTWQTALNLTLPYHYISAEIQPQTQFPEAAHFNSGGGDIAFGVQHHFGNSGAFMAHATCIFPTGSYDRQYGAEQSRKILPPVLQTGQGLYHITLGGKYFIQRENGFLSCGATVNIPFTFRLDKENEYLDSYYSTYQDVTANRERFYYERPLKPYGETDRGDYIPPSLQFSLQYAGTPSAITVHSLQCTFNTALATRWIRSYEPYRYAPYPDPGHTAWSLLIAYGFEYSGFRVPFFTGIGLPVYDKPGPDNHWDGIATEELFNNWIFTAGVTLGIF